MRLTLMLILGCGLAAAGGCKRSPSRPDMMLSPLAKVPATPGSGAKFRPPGEGQRSALGAPNWGDEKAAAGGASPAARPDAMSDATVALLKRRDTELAVSRSLGAMRSTLEACYNREATGPTSLRLTLRLHHTGRVLDANVTGVPASARRCMLRALDQVRVPGVKTDNITITRDLQFK
jgi:hypothetical protein